MCLKLNIFAKVKNQKLQDNFEKWKIFQKKKKRQLNELNICNWVGAWDTIRGKDKNTEQALDIDK